MSKKYKLLDSIEESEVRPLILLFLFSFFNGTALVFFKTTASTLFLIHYDIVTLPYVYILTALVSVIAGYLYGIIENKVTIVKLLRLTLSFVIVVLLSLLLLTKISDSRWIYMALMVSEDLIWMFISIGFGIVTSMLFTIRQGKRLFGILISGEIIAGILGGISVTLILKYIDTVDLLWISSLSLGLSFLLLHTILSSYPTRFEEKNEESFSTQESSYRTLFQNKYYLLFFAVSSLSFFIFYFIDYIFYYSVEAHFPDEKELASFFGIFYAVLNAVTLFSSLFVSGTMLSRFGVLFGIMIIPILAIVGTSSLLVTMTFSLSISFALLLILKLFDEVFDMSILTPTLKVLYQSIPTQQKIKVLTIKEMMIEPISIGLVGLLLLALLSFDMIYIIYYLILFVSIVWMIFSKMLRNYYKLSLEKLLSQREIIADTFSLDTIDDKLLLKGIQSDNEIEVIYSLDSLIKVHYPDINTLLIELLNHPNTQVRLSVLGFIDQLDKEELLGDLKQHIKIESDDTVLHDLLRLYCKLGSMDAIETISPYIHHHHPEVQKGAILGLLQYGGIDGILVAGKVLDDLFSSDKRADQVISLNILKQIKTPSFYHPLSKLLESDDIEIRSLAITVIGNLKITQFIPNLLTNLTADDYRNITTIALLQFNSKIFPQLRTFFHQTPSIESKYALIKVIAMLKEEESYHFLLDQLAEPQLSDMIYEKLFDSDFSTKNQHLIERLLHQEIEKILSFLHLLTVLDANLFPNSFLVIEEFIARKIENIFSIIGFYYNKKTILQAILNYQNSSKDKRAYAVEVIDNMVSASMRKIVLPILDDTNSEKKLSSYTTDMPETIQDPEKIIGIAISQEERPLILRLSLLYELGQHHYPIDINLIEDLIQDPNPEIRQTALWTLHQLKKAHHVTDD